MRNTARAAASNPAIWFSKILSGPRRRPRARIFLCGHFSVTPMQHLDPDHSLPETTRGRPCRQPEVDMPSLHLGTGIGNQIGSRVSAGIANPDTGSQGQEQRIGRRRSRMRTRPGRRGSMQAKCRCPYAIPGEPTPPARRQRRAPQCGCQYDTRNTPHTSGHGRMRPCRSRGCEGASASPISAR